jgi:hypothetical protein
MRLQHRAPTAWRRTFLATSSRGFVSNSIYFDRADVAPVPGRPAPTPSLHELRVPPDSWRIEANPTSRASIDTDKTGGVVWSYRLGDGMPAGQYAALATDASGTAALDRIAITAASDAPMRLSLQVRVPGRTGRAALAQVPVSGSRGEDVHHPPGRAGTR